MELGLKDKVAIVTGGTQGIGKAAVIALAREGAKVAIVARDKDRLDQTARTVGAAGGEALPVSADVSKVADIERTVAEVLQRWGRIDILVNNAGTSVRGDFATVDDATWQFDFDLKLFAAIRLSRLAIPHMKKHGGGRIINITNTGAKQPGASSMPTTVTRAAGLALTKALSKEFAADNILVNTICIGRIKAGQWETRARKLGVPLEKLYTDMSHDIPMKRIGEAEEVANVITFLASSAASYVTGTSINLDGGISGVL